MLSRSLLSVVAGPHWGSCALLIAHRVKSGLETFHPVVSYSLGFLYVTLDYMSPPTATTEVAPDVELLSENAGADVVTVVYLVRGVWRVEVSAHPAQPWPGPASIQVTFGADADDAQEAIARANETRGITADVLTAIPLADARARLRALVAQERLAEHAEFLRQRCQTPEQWAKFASVYVLATQITNRPVAALGEVSGRSRDTMAERAKQARAKGLLTPPTDDSLGELTASAKRLLRRAHTEGKN